MCDFSDGFLLSATTPDSIRGYPFFFIRLTKSAAVPADWKTTGAKALRLIWQVRGILTLLSHFYFRVISCFSW